MKLVIKPGLEKLAVKNFREAKYQVDGQRDNSATDSDLMILAHLKDLLDCIEIVEK